jgi:hypothetical protein
MREKEKGNKKERWEGRKWQRVNGNILNFPACYFSLAFLLAAAMRCVNPPSIHPPHFRLSSSLISFILCLNIFFFINTSLLLHLRLRRLFHVFSQLLLLLLHPLPRIFKVSPLVLEINIRLTRPLALKQG